MATWSLSPQYKKSAVEVMFFRKDNMVISIEQGFRWATFKVESDERPLTDEELVNEDGYELGSIANDESWEMWEMVDGCWLDINRACSHVSDEAFEEFETAWEEDSFEGVEALGWCNDDTEYHYHGPLALTNEDTGEEFLGEKDEQLTPGAVKEFLDGYADVVENMSDEEWDNLGKEESAVTDWFPVEINPVRNGTYEAINDKEEVKWPFVSNTFPAVWNGKKWDQKITKWRGLAKDPNGEK